MEHVFAVVKQQPRFRKTLNRGLRKQAAKLNILFALANLILPGSLSQCAHIDILKRYPNHDLSSGYLFGSQKVICAVLPKNFGRHFVGRKVADVPAKP